MQNRSPEKSQIPGEGIKTRKWRLAWEHPAGETEAIASLAAIEARLAETRQCPHCDTPGAVSQGMARELRRYPG